VTIENGSEHGVVRFLFFCGLVKPARLKMLPNVLAAGHTTSGCSMFQNHFFGAAIWINLETDAGSPLLIDRWPSDLGDEREPPSLDRFHDLLDIGSKVDSLRVAEDLDPRGRLAACILRARLGNSTVSGLGPICRVLLADRIRAIRQEQEEPCDRNLNHSDTIGSDR
jgi:hypothetical protein